MTDRISKYPRQERRKSRFFEEVLPAFGQPRKSYEEHLREVAERGYHEHECMECGYVWLGGRELLPVCPRCG